MLHIFDAFWQCLLTYLSSDDQQLMAGWEMLLMHRKGYGSNLRYQSLSASDSSQRPRQQQRQQ